MTAAPSGPLADADLTARGRRTRERLIGAAFDVFARDGFLDARVTDIADAAGAGHGTFYRYFASKEDIFREVALRLLDEVYDASGSNADTREPAADRPHDEPTAWDRIDHANRAYLAAIRRRAPLLRALDQAASHNPAFTVLRRDLRHRFVTRAERGLVRLQADGRADATLDAHATAAALGGMVEHFAWVRYVLDDDDIETELAANTLTRLWAQAIALDATPNPGPSATHHPRTKDRP